MTLVDQYLGPAQREKQSRLAIEHAEQTELLHLIRQLGTDLTETPYVVPTESRTTLQGIRLSGSHMSLDIAEKEGGVPDTSISLLERSRSQFPELYVHRPSLDVWDQFKGNAKPTIVTNTFVVGRIDEIAPKEVCAALLDKVPTGFDIANALAMHLRRRASKYTETKHYVSTNDRLNSTMDTVIEDPTVIAENFSRTSELFVQKINQRTIHYLMVSAQALLDIGTLTKNYTYRIDETTQAGLRSSGGVLTLKSTGNISQEHLNAFAKQDAKGGDPVRALQNAINDLRTAFDTPA